MPKPKAEKFVRFIGETGVSTDIDPYIEVVEQVTGKRIPACQASPERTVILPAPLGYLALRDPDQYQRRLHPHFAKPKRWRSKCHGTGAGSFAQKVHVEFAEGELEFMKRKSR